MSLAWLTVITAIIYIADAARQRRIGLLLLGQVFLLSGAAALLQFFPHRYSYAALISCVVLLRLVPASNGEKCTFAARFGDLEYRAAVFLSLAVAATSIAAFSAPDRYWPNAWPSHVWLRTSLIAGAGITAAFVLTTKRLARTLGGLLLMVFTALLLVSTPASGFGVTSNVKQMLAFGPMLVSAGWLLLSGVCGLRTATEVSVRARCAGILIAFLSVSVFVRANYFFRTEATVHGLMCYDAASGDTLWKRELHREPTPPMGGLSSMSATPAANGDVVVAHFGSATGAFDFEGNLLWKRVNRDYFAKSVYGVGSSPLIVDRSVILLQEVERAPHKAPVSASAIGRYDLATGNRVWHTELPFATNSYSTPVLRTTPSSRELVFATHHRIAGVDFDSGALLWSVETPAVEVVSSLAMDADRVFLAGGCARGVVMALDLESMSHVPKVLWRQNAPSMISSPVSAEGLLFTLTDDAELVCRRSSDGKKLWSEYISQANSYASLVLAGTKLYIVDSQGAISVFRAAAMFQNLGEYRLNEIVYATPALTDTSLFIRTESHLYCLR
jgi:outer membrane protein assembly factor BamB